MNVKLLNAIQNSTLRDIKDIVSSDESILDSVISNPDKPLVIALWSGKTRVIEYLLTYQTCQYQMIGLIFKEYKQQEDWEDLLSYIENL